MGLLETSRRINDFAGIDCHRDAGKRFRAIKPRQRHPPGE
jgi:hypothetical protein